MNGLLDYCASKKLIHIYSIILVNSKLLPITFHRWKDQTATDFLFCEVKSWNRMEISSFAGSHWLFIRYFARRNAYTELQEVASKTEPRPDSTMY